MSNFRTRCLKMLAIAVAGTAFQLLTQPTGCAQYGVLVALQTLDICSVLNCTGGSFFNFCDPAVIFVDCP